MIQGELLESANVLTGPLPHMYADPSASAEGPIGKRATWLVAARKSYLQYIINRTSDEPSLGFSFWDVQGKAAVAVTPRHQVSLTLIDGRSGLDRDPTRVSLGPNTVSDSGYHYALAYVGWRYTRAGCLLT